MTLKISHVTKSNAIAGKLAALHGISGLPWRRIAQIPEFYGIPIRTLSAIARQDRGIPKKFRKQLRVPDIAKVPVCTNPTCSGYGRPHVYDCQTQAVKKKRPDPPAWVRQAADNLATLEQRARPGQNRTYNRKGKRVS